MTRALPLRHLGRTTFAVEPQWLLAIVALDVALAYGYFPARLPDAGPVVVNALALAGAAALVAALGLHGAVTAAAARRSGLDVERVDLWLLGAIPRLGACPERARDGVVLAAAGPATSLALATGLALVAVAAGDALGDAGAELVLWTAGASAVVGAANLMPAYPLAGGWLVRMLAERAAVQLPSVEQAAALARAVAVPLAAVGALQLVAGWMPGGWIAAGALLVIRAATVERAHAERDDAVPGTPAERAMRPPPACIPANLPVARALAEFHVDSRTPAYALVGAGRVVAGIVLTEQMLALAPELRDRTPVASLAECDPELIAFPGTDLEELVERAAFTRAGHAVVVAASGSVLGLVSAEDARAALAARERERRPPR